MAALGSEIAARYRLDRRLGAGGMSTVYLAFDSILERQVAVKLLAEHLAEDEGFVARFRREALAAAKLTHPNIVQVYDSGWDEQSGRHYIVMEYVEGETVGDMTRRRERPPLDEAVEIVAQGCQGLEYAHRHGVIHRDVKPGNLIVNRDAIVKLADFGIAKAAEDSQITQIGSVLGTAAYLSPERARGEEASPSSDVYSLGVVLYQLLAGKLPYESGSLTELALRQQESDPEPLSSLNPDVPPQLSRAVARSLAAEPRDRYASAAEMREAIEEGARGVDSRATLALEAAATQRLPAADTAATQALPRKPTPVQPRHVATPAPVATAPRRGRLTRFLALAFLFALITAVVAAVVVINLDSSQSHHFERVVTDRIHDQIDGLRRLIDNATR